MRSWIVIAALGLCGTACDVRVGENGGVSLNVAGIGRVSDDWRRTYTLAEGGTLEIVNVNGPIDVEPASGGQVEVRATREAKATSASDARTLLKETRILETISPTHVRIETPEPPASRGFGASRGGVSVAYHVRIPGGLVVKLQTLNGRVRLEKVDGQMTVVATNGGVDGTMLTGAVNATAINGGVRLELLSMNGPVAVSTVNGSIRLALSTSIDASLDASAINGGVSADNVLPLHITQRTSQRMTGTLNKGGAAIALQATNGGVRVVPWSAR